MAGSLLNLIGVKHSWVLLPFNVLRGYFLSSLPSGHPVRQEPTSKLYRRKNRLSGIGRGLPKDESQEVTKPRFN